MAGEALGVAGIVALVVAIASLGVSAWALRRAGRASGVQAGVDPARAAAPAPEKDAGAGERSTRAHLHVALVATARRHHVVVSNLGPGAARQVSLSVKARAGNGASPLVQADCDEKLPIPELGPGREIALLASLSSAMGTEFDARLAWINSDGSRESLATSIHAS